MTSEVALPLWLVVLLIATTLIALLDRMFMPSVRWFVRRRAASIWPPASISRTDVDEPTIVVGQVAKAHGVRGEVSVRNRSDNPERWVAGARLLTADGRALTAG